MIDAELPTVEVSPEVAALFRRTGGPGADGYNYEAIDFARGATVRLARAGIASTLRSSSGAGSTTLLPW